MTTLQRSIALSLIAFLFAIPSAGQITFAPTMGIDVRSPNEEIELRFGGMLSWSEALLGVAVRGDTPALTGGSGFSLSAGPTVRLADDGEYTTHVIPSAGFARMPLGGDLSSPYAPQVGLLFHATDGFGGVVLGIEHNFKGSAETAGLRFTRGPYTTLIAGFSVTF